MIVTTEKSIRIQRMWQYLGQGGLEMEVGGEEEAGADVRWALTGRQGGGDRPYLGQRSTEAVVEADAWGEPGLILWG